MELTREELVELIKQTIADLKKEEKVAELDKAIENENECHENIVENLEQEKQDVEAGVVQNSEPSKIQNQCDSVQNECGDDKKTEVKNTEESDKSEVTEEVKEEVKEEIQEGKEDGKTKEEVKEEVKEEIVEEKEEEKEKKEEVIKIEALNSAPTALKDVSGKDKWMNLHGKDFWDYLAKHPEIKG